MSVHRAEIDGPGVRDVLVTPATRAILEVARRARREITAEWVASILPLDTTTVQRSLDALSDAGFAQRMRVRATRRVPSYRVMHDAFVLVFDPGNPAHQAAVEEIAAALRAHARHQVGSDAEDTRVIGPPWPLRAFRGLLLEPHEFKELQHLMSELIRFLDATHARMTGNHGQDARSLNLAIAIEAFTPDPATWPFPPIHFLPADQVDGFQHATDPRSLGALSTRERSVAMMLTAGHSRPQVARKLGISINTVGTLTKRIYAKLAVRTRVELANRLRRGT